MERGFFLSPLVFDRPPIIEALCEFHFSEAGTGDPDFIGLFYERAREKYPKLSPVASLQIQLGVRQMGAPTAPPAVPPPRPFVRLQDENGHVVQLGLGYLSVHILREYTEWPQLREMVEEALSWYRECSGVDNLPATVTMRFINRFSIEEVSAGAVSRTLKINPNIPPSFADRDLSLSSYLSVSQAKVDDFQLTVVTTAQSSEGGNGLILDLGISSTDAVPYSDILGALDEAHGIVEVAFLSYLTDVTIENLGGAERG